ncbi:hypothetical protein Sru01_22810 [Sphaerisporangium rufum]|uniref:Septum formation initiator n=1 Tax=Sphaerisporangium rufum TaxID=1381558 RepID=A0A919R0A3_9ACTN|nr:hypothetical protein [Sphaerisporangium rufum]GII77299.1 hypothetical protein Sru01_22810 [Sphaerisporangium rufum]
MKRRSLLAALGFAAVAALTTLTSTWAISLLGAGLSENVVAPMSRAEVARALAAATGTPAPAPPAGGTAPRAFHAPGGSVTASCAGDRAVLRSWSPALGYGAEDVSAGPAPAASVEFESETETITVRVTCPGGAAKMTYVIEADRD